jgi:hypothetical protein
MRRPGQRWRRSRPAPRSHAGSARPPATAGAPRPQRPASGRPAPGSGSAAGRAGATVQGCARTPSCNGRARGPEVRGRGSEAAVGRVRSSKIGVALPAPDHGPGLGQAGEHLLVQALVAAPADEALHAGVLGWLARRDVGPQGAGPVGRFQHGPRGQFGAVVADDHRETATPDDQRIEFARHPLAADRAVDDQGERLAREVAHDRQNPAPPAQDSTSAAKRWSAACGMVIGARVPVARLRPRRRRTASPSSRYRR